MSRTLLSLTTARMPHIVTALIPSVAPPSATKVPAKAPRPRNSAMVQLAISLAVLALFACAGRQVQAKAPVYS